MRKVIAALLLCLSIPAFADGFFVPKASTPIVDFYPGWSGSAQVVHSFDGFVHLRGVANGDNRIYGGQAYAWKLFVLPVGSRPAMPEYFLVAADGGPAAINVMPDGWVWVATNSSIWVSLSGVSFEADH